jgi:hypothetical protein
MNLITIIIIGFLILEIINVVTLYLFPGSKYANAVGIFNAWEKSKNDPEIHNFVKYLVNWVAGSKLIFIMLLIVILLTADEQSLIVTSIAMVISIASFFWRLFPLIRKMDQEGQITPQKYSTVLGVMISAFILTFLLGIVFSIGK